MLYMRINGHFFRVLKTAKRLVSEKLGEKVTDVVFDGNRLCFETKKDGCFAEMENCNTDVIAVLKGFMNDSSVSWPDVENKCCGGTCGCDDDEEDDACEYCGCEDCVCHERCDCGFDLCECD